MDKNTLDTLPEFASLHSYEHFEQSVKTKARFVYDDAVTSFLQTVVDTVGPRRRPVPAGRAFFRAQRGCSQEPVWGSGNDDPVDECEAALPSGQMVPKAEFVGEGRVNPRGIPCLYLACTAAAAISEMRPPVCSHITLAQFKTVRDCLLVDCTLNTRQSLWLEPVDGVAPSPPDAATKENGAWGDIGFAFSKPVTRDEPHIDYVPTQILAETFRHHGYDGIVYKSRLDKNGKNIALFDVAAATQISRCLYEVRAACLDLSKREFSPSSWPESISSELEEIEFF